MRTANTRRRRNSFGGGSYAHRHGPGFQAVSGVVVVSLAVGTLCLHHFGFGIALVLALGMAAICALTRLRAAVTVYAVGAALFVGILMTPMVDTPNSLVFPGAGATESFFSDPGQMEHEIYVLEMPLLDRSHLRPAPFESTSPFDSPERDEDGAWSTPLPSPDSRRIFEL